MTEPDAIEVELFEELVLHVVDSVEKFDELFSFQLAVVQVDDLQVFLLLNKVKNALETILVCKPGRSVVQIQLVDVEDFEVDQVA